MARPSKTTTLESPKAETPANPPVTLTPEALQAVIAQAVADATAKLRYELAAKPSSANGKSDRSAQNEILAIKAFKKAGYGIIKPHTDALTYNKWIEKGFKVKPGEKSVKVKNLRLSIRAKFCQ
jgi:hypothetical protein